MKDYDRVKEWVRNNPEYVSKVELTVKEEDHEWISILQKPM